MRNSKTTKYMNYNLVEFHSQGATVRGRFYLPENKSLTHPIVIMAHGFTATISGMCADKYAEEFCKTGLAVLLFDHRNFGISDGLPRQEINKWLQARGYVDAINYVCTLDTIEKNNIALWGDSMSGAEVLLVSSVEKRVKAIVIQVPACGDVPAPADEDGALCTAMIEYFEHGDIAGKPETTIGPMLVVSFDQQGTPSLLKPLTAFRWFIEYGGRYNTLWKNSATFVDPNAVTIFHPGLCAKHIRAAVLMMIGEDDEMPGASSAIARLVFDSIPAQKELIEMDGGHFGIIHYPSPLFDQASKAQIDFLNEHLK